MTSDCPCGWFGAGAPNPPPWLASDVRARIGLDEEIEDDKLEVSASHGRVTVSGKARTRHQTTRVEEVVRQIPGVTEVECHAGV